MKGQVILNSMLEHTRETEQVDPEVLTRLQINQCLIDIEAMHPLLYTA
jgi:uncharacterized membrane-anchored protein